MNRLVCPRDKIALGNLFFEGEERSSRTQGGHACGVVNRDPRTSSEQSGEAVYSIGLSCFYFFFFQLIYLLVCNALACVNSCTVWYQ